MKTIILCGGRGTRLHEETAYKPKPMVEIGNRPILVHIMELYARYGHREFLLCLGYKGNEIRDYFLRAQNFGDDIELTMATGEVRVLQRRVKFDFTVSFIETGADSDTAERVLRAARYIDDEEFMVSYGDDVGNIDFKKLLAFHDRQKKLFKTLATITAVHPTSHFGQVVLNKSNVVTVFSEKPLRHEYVNGGFMVFTQKALNYLRSGETLEDGLARMADQRKLAAYQHTGFWQAMNTMKDVRYLNQLWKKGKPWVK